MRIIIDNNGDNIIDNINMKNKNIIIINSEFSSLFFLFCNFS